MVTKSYKFSGFFPMRKAQIKDNFLDKLRTHKCESNIDHVIESTQHIKCMSSLHTRALQCSKKLMY